MTSLTGRTRYREGWFGRLILQVEETRIRIEKVYGVLSGYDIRHPYTVWRDARAMDFTRPDVRAIFRDDPIPYPGQRPPTER